MAKIKLFSPRIGAGVFFLAATTLGHALASDTARSPGQLDHSHAGWTQILKRHVVVEGPKASVNYKAIQEAPSELNNYLKQIENVTAEQYGSFSESEKLSFLINAYNALTIKLIVDHYPVKSIKDIGGVFSSPWKKEFFTLFGKKRHLDHIEHDLIRKQFDEPRIHFALVCAAKGCPALRNDAFTARRLDEQLEEQARAFLRNKSQNFFNADKRELKVSSIFKWYGSDFDKKHGSFVAFIAPRMVTSPEEARLIRSAETKVSYLPYDWSLNAYER